MSGKTKKLLIYGALGFAVYYFLKKSGKLGGFSGMGSLGCEGGKMCAACAAKSGLTGMSCCGSSNLTPGN